MKIILLGEAMGLFMAEETGPLNQVERFRAAIAGAEYNVAVGLARLGHEPAYCTRLGGDPMGLRIREGMAANSIDQSLCLEAPGELTGFMLKGSTLEGDPDIAYYRKGSAASRITAHDIDKLDLFGCGGGEERGAVGIGGRPLGRADGLPERFVRRGRRALRAGYRECGGSRGTGR